MSPGSGILLRALGSFHRARDMCSGYISHPAPLSILFAPFVRLSRFRMIVCVCVRARIPVPISAYLGSRCFGALRNVARSAAPVEMYPNKCPVETIEKCRRFGGLFIAFSATVDSRTNSFQKKKLYLVKKKKKIKLSNAYF